MLGAIIGDIVGSPYEFGSRKRMDFPLFSPSSRPTDDSLMTIAVGLGLCQAELDSEYSVKECVARNMRMLARLYPNAGFGDMFYRWVMDDSMGPYGSFGNGSAMRVSAVAYAARDLSHCLTLARWSAEVTHDHPDGIEGAQAVAAAIYLARTGKSKDQIRAYIEENFYSLDFTIARIRDGYGFDVTCRGSVPQAIRCFLDGEDFEDVIRLAVSLGGDCDTQSAIAGSIAEAFYGIADDLAQEALARLDEIQLEYYETARDNLL